MGVTNIANMFGKTFVEVKGNCEIHGDYLVSVFETDGVAADAYCAECVRIKIDTEYEAEQKKQKAAQVEKSLMQRIERAEIPPRLANKGYTDYIPKTAKASEHVANCKSFATDWEKTFETGANLIMCGTPGTGKTHLASVICRQVASQNIAYPLYTTVSRMIRHIRNSYNRDSDYTESAALKKFTGACLLVVDEVGVKLSSDHERSMLFEIIDERYQQMMPTIIISNLKIGEIGAHTDERMVDRLSENGLLMIFDWESHRGEV